MKSCGTTDIKLLNRRNVFDYIKSKEGQIVSRPEIAKALQITNPTVLKIIDFFLQKGILSNLGESDSISVGRKPNMLCFEPNSAYSIGVDYNGKVLKVAVVNLNGETISFYSDIVRVSIQELFEKVLPEKILALDLEFSKVIAAGIALPTAIDPKNNVISMCNELIDSSGQEDCSLYVEILSHRLGIPVFLENDVNAAAISHFSFRTSSEKNDLIFLMLGFGLGAGIILDGILRRGRHYAAGEIGYMTLNLEENLPEKGAGWLETVLGQKYIQEHFETDIFSENEPASANEELTEYIASRISIVITNLAVSLDIDYFVLGGLFVKKFGNELIEAIQVYCQKICPYPVQLIVDTAKDTIACGMGGIAIGGVLDYYLSDEYARFVSPSQNLANFQGDLYSKYDKRY